MGMSTMPLNLPTNVGTGHPEAAARQSGAKISTFMLKADSTSRRRVTGGVHATCARGGAANARVRECA